MSEPFFKGLNISTALSTRAGSPAGRELWSRIAPPEDQRDPDPPDTARQPDLVQMHDNRSQAASFMQNGCVKSEAIRNSGSDIDESRPSLAFSPTPGAAVTARLQHVVRSAGALAAAQALRAALQPLSPPAVTTFLDSSEDLIATLFEHIRISAVEDNSRGKEGERPVVTRTALALSELSAAFDRDPRNTTQMRLSQPSRGRWLASTAGEDDVIFGALSQAVEVGACFKLSLMIVEALAEETQDPARHRALRILLAIAFRRLGERIGRVYEETQRHCDPLLLEWISWRAASPAQAATALRAFLQSRPDFLKVAAAKLERSEKAGLEAYRAISALAASQAGDELCEARQMLVGDTTILAAIATSRTALLKVRQASLGTVTEEGDGLCLDAVKLQLEHIGFQAPRAQFLADLSGRIGHRSMLEAGWTALDDFSTMQAKGAVFQRLLALLNGQYLVVAQPVMISFDDLDK